MAEAVEKPQLGGYMEDWSEGEPHFSGEKNVAQFYNGRTFPGCRHMPVHLVSLDLNRFNVLSAPVRKIGALHLVYSNCEACDAWMMSGEDYDAEMFFHIGHDHRLTPIGAEKYGIRCQEGSVTFAPREKMAIRFQPYTEDDEYPPVFVGGDPKWVQGDDWLLCPECEKGMEFVSRIRAGHLEAVSFGDQDLFAFVCPDCRIAGLKMQMT